MFDFSEIMERTEKRVGDEVLGAGPQNVDELRAIARRVKSKYLMRIQLKEKHSIVNPTSSPLGKQIPPMPSKEVAKKSMKNVTNSVIGGVGGFVSMLKPMSRGGSSSDVASKGTTTAEGGGPSTNDVNHDNDAPATPGGQEVEVEFNLLGSPTSPVNPFNSPASPPNNNDATAEGEEVDELEKLSAELGELSAVTAEAFDLLGDDFNTSMEDGVDHHSEELLDAMDIKVDPMEAFMIDDDDFLS